MSVIPMLLAMGLSNLSLNIEPPRQFELVCEGRTANIYDPSLSRPYHWQGHLDLDALSARNDDGAATPLEVRDDRFASWGPLTFDRGQNQLIEISADGRERTVAHCAQSPVF